MTNAADTAVNDSVIAVLDDDAKRRFWSNVDRRAPDECWPWLGERNAEGYGRLFHYVSGRRYNLRASRIALALDGRPAHGRLAMHSCDNPPCCNPAHLSPGTALDNARDAASKGRSGTCRGSLHYQTRLSEDDIVSIRREYATNADVDQETLAKKYGVTKSAIGCIVRGNTWKHVPLDVPMQTTRLPGRARPITWRGVTKSISEWSRETGIPKWKIRARIAERGWDADRALTTPALADARQKLRALEAELRKGGGG